MKEYTHDQMCMLWLNSADVMSWNSIRQLTKQFGSPSAVWNAFGPFMRELLGKSYDRLTVLHDSGNVSHVLDSLRSAGADAFFPDQKAFPEKLLNIEDRPEILYVRGSVSVERSVAIVGSRRDTRYGRQQAFSIAKSLAENGITIVSGMARGIDTAAHEGAIAGGGKTVAVLGCGVDVCYPPENRILMENILAKGGAVVSEYTPGSQPLSYHFPLRNRIISGLSDALLLIEAKQKSGTNSTVNYALAQGKEIFALPGNVDSPGSELPLKLLKDGAQMCTCADDILEYMQWRKTDAPNSVQLSFNTKDDPLLDALAMEEKTFEELAEETGLSAGELGSRLTILEMTGIIEKRAGRTYALKMN